MRRLALALVLFAVAAVCVLLILGRERVRTSPEPPDERSEPARDEPSATLTSTSTSERPVEPPAKALPLPAASVAESATRELPQRLFGSLVLTDGQGREHPGESGRFTLMLWSGETAKGFAVEARAGEWSVERAPAGRLFDTYSAQGFEFGSREAKGERAPEEKLPIPADGRIELRARFPMELLLHVQAEESGAELEHAFVLDADRGDRGLPHPGWVEHLPKAKPCPLVLAAPSEDSRAVYVGAPGRAWKRVEILAEIGERVVQLAPGGDLDVIVRGEVEVLLHTVVRITPAGAARGGLLALFPLGTASERLVRGLPLGTYDVTARLGERDSPPIGRVQAEVLAGTTAEAVLVLDHVEAPTWVALEGRLRLSPAWNLDDFELVIELEGAALGGWDGQIDVPRARMELVDAASGEFRWQARVQPGKYEVFVPQTSFFDRLEVGPAGLRDALVDVPPPCELVVRCLDQDGAPTDASLGWAYSNGAMVQGQAPFLPDRERGTWTLRAPAGTVFVSAFRWDQSVTGNTVLRPGRNELELRFSAFTGLEVALMDRTTRVPWERGLAPSLRPLAGQGAPTVAARDAERVVLAAPPGAYVLSIPDLPGYHSIPDATVQLERGKLLRRVVELRRKP